MAQQINYTGYNLHWIGLGQKIHKVFFVADEPEKQWHSKKWNLKPYIVSRYSMIEWASQRG